MKRTVPVIGRIDSSGEAHPFPAVKVIGGIDPFIECPACGQLIDKRDLAAVLAHERACPATTSRP